MDEHIAPQDILNLSYNRRTNQIEIFQDDVLSNPVDGLTLSNLPLVKTANAKQTLLHIRPWLRHAESFIVVGPEGCGKTYVFQ